MEKERLVTFTDAVLAIIMTILVLELKKPTEPTLAQMWALRESFLAYALSFFWLGAMWINLHNIWSKASKISTRVIGWNMVLLFLLSLIPYATSLVSTYYDNAVIQGFYGVVVIIISIVNIGLNKMLQGANKDNKSLKKITKRYIDALVIDIDIKIVGLIMAISIYPQAMMISVFITSVLMARIKN